MAPLPGRTSRETYGATASVATIRRMSSSPSAIGCVSRSSARKPWSIAGGRSGSVERSSTRPRERGFIAKTAALAS